MTAPDIASPELGIRNLLLATPAITALVVDRVFVDVAKQDHDKPAIVVKIAGRVGADHIEGPSGLARYRLQLDVIADRASEIRDLKNQVRLALDGFTGAAGGQDFDSIRFDNETGSYDGRALSRVRILDFICWLREGTL